MIKLLHTSDIHLGAKFAMLGAKSGEAREDLKLVFSDIVDKAVKEDFDFLLISGDLFDSNRACEKIIDFVKEEFKKLDKSRAKAVLIPGSHDWLGEGCPYLRKDFYKGFKNIFIFNDPKISHKKFLEKDITFWAKPNISNRSPKSPIELEKLDLSSTKYNICLAHGSIQIEKKSAKDDWPIGLEEIKNSGFNYIALGHWHGAQDFSRGSVKCYYSGSPEILDLEKKGGAGSGYILEVNIDSEVTIKPFKISKKEFDLIDIDLGEINNTESLKDKITESASQNLIRVINLKGFKDPGIFIDQDILEEELEDKFFKLKINNNSHIKLDKINEKNYPPELLSGQFLKIAQKKIKTAKTDQERQILEEALQIGLAELEGRNVI